MRGMLAMVLLVMGLSMVEVAAWGDCVGDQYDILMEFYNAYKCDQRTQVG